MLYHIKPNFRRAMSWIFWVTLLSECTISSATGTFLKLYFQGILISVSWKHTEFWIVETVQYLACAFILVLLWSPRTMVRLLAGKFSSRSLSYPQCAAVIAQLLPIWRKNNNKNELFCRSWWVLKVADQGDTALPVSWFLLVNQEDASPRIWQFLSIHMFHFKLD